MRKKIQIHQTLEKPNQKVHKLHAIVQKKGEIKNHPFRMVFQTGDTA